MRKAIVEIDLREWHGPFTHESSELAVDALEAGSVLLFPKLEFTLGENEREFLSPSVLAKSKNVSFNPANGKVGGTSCTGEAEARIGAMMSRFSNSAKQLIEELLSPYHGKLALGRTSFRPAEVAGRASSWRKDDTRLHIDAFPTTPTHGNRILRIFSNVNPDGKPRVWRVGEPFQNVAEKFAGRLKRPVWGSSTALLLFGITKSRRSEYDHLMLELHDEMKKDTQYQEEVEQSRCEFSPGSTWACFVDSVSHAAMAGQHQFEQTFYLPVGAMKAEPLAPLRVLERQLGRQLA